MIFPAAEHKNQSGRVSVRVPISPASLDGSRGSSGSAAGSPLLWLPWRGAWQHIAGTSAPPASPSGIWGSAQCTRRVRGGFWQFCSGLDHPPRSPMQYLPQHRAAPGRSRPNRRHRVPRELCRGAVGNAKPHISNDFLTNSAAHCLFSFINCSTPAI